MAKDLVSFLAKNPVNEITKTITLSGRLAEFELVIKPMTSKEFYKYQQIATMITGGDKKVNFNTGRFNELVVLNHLINPDLKSVEILGKLGVEKPEDALNKFFLSGELSQISEQISKLSGFDTTDEDLEKEVKNS